MRLDRFMYEAALLCGLLASAEITVGQTYDQRVGVTHVQGDYYFTTNDYLNEGADQVLRLGTKVIKHYLFDPKTDYPFNSVWPASFTAPVMIAQHPYYLSFFAKPFRTFIMTTYSSVSGDAMYWRNGVSVDQAAAEKQQFHDLAYYFLTTYNGTGKTFILQHWEGDWSLRGNTNTDVTGDPTPSEIQGMIDWLNVRQDGVTQARSEVPGSDVKVYSACEVNLVQLAMQGRPTVTNNVLPFTHCDLYSYSAWDSLGGSGTTLTNALNYIASKAPDSAAFGAKNVYLGEYGSPENDAGSATSLSVTTTATQAALTWGCPFILYWQIYDNECNPDPLVNTDCRGFWLTRLDGTLSPSRDYLVSVINSSPPGVNLAAPQASADSMNSAAEVPSKAIDGVIASTSKWTSAGTALPHWLALDLGKNRSVHTFVVRHASDEGETTNFNLTQFRFQSAPSLSGPWTDEFVVDNSSKYKITFRNYFDRKTLRYVRLYVTNSGIDQYARVPEFEVWGDGAVPAFTGSPTKGMTPLAVQFTDQSTGNIDGWLWDFGDGGTSTQQNPSHTYHRPGLFTVKLAVTDVTGADSYTQAGYIKVIGPDLDGDGDVDQSDFGLLQACLSGSEHPYAPNCALADLDQDGDVDSADLAIWMQCVAGADVPSPCQ